MRAPQKVTIRFVNGDGTIAGDYTFKAGKLVQLVPGKDGGGDQLRAMARRLDRLESSFGLKPNTERERQMLERLEAGRRRVMAACGENYFTRHGPREEVPRYATVAERLALGRARARADWERRRANGEVKEQLRRLSARIDRLELKVNPKPNQHVRWVVSGMVERPISRRQPVGEHFQEPDSFGSLSI